MTSTTSELESVRRLDDLPTASEWQEYFERGFADDNPLQVRNRAMFMLMHRTGISLTEACALEVSDVDALRGDVYVRGGDPADETVHTAHFEPDAAIRTALAQWLVARAELGSRTSRLFTTWQGEPVCDVAPLAVQMRDAAMRSWHNKGLAPSGGPLDEFALRNALVSRVPS